ncbi:type II secretion system protein D precursor [Methylomusa anaerophila]|uniref:Type II secretion system protein D n=3 Tax=Methylomusa anaerophila TaxID=1930071 RepID=A0A348AKC0_9FIRM|nr:type II secretion system protein D precursor [Methylomusa anaerophila]
MFLRQYRKTAVAALIAGLLIFTLPVAASTDAVNDGPPPAAAGAAPAGGPDSTPGQAPAANPADPPANPPDQAPAAAPQPAFDLPAPDPGLPANTGLSPLVIKLEYVKAEQVKAMLAALFPDNRVRAEIINGMLVAVGSEEDCAMVKDMLARIDVAPKQVIFEAEAIEVSRDDARKIGIDWGPVTALPGAATTDGSSFRLGLGIPNHEEYGVNVSATIRHLVETKKGRLLASPRIAALDGQTAQILIGDKLAVESTQISSGTTITTVTYVEVGIKLEVTPTIHADGTISTHIKPEVSNKTDTTSSGNPNIRTRQAETTLRVKNGETIVLGGLIQRQETQDTVKFPLLGDIPIIGQFFRSTTKEKTESELIILITPKLIE